MTTNEQDPTMNDILNTLAADAMRIDALIALCIVAALLIVKFLG